MKRLWILTTMLVLLLAPTSLCPTTGECKSVIDRQIKIVHDKAARDGWIDEAKERD